MGRMASRIKQRVKDLQNEYKGCHVVVWFPKDASIVKFGPGSRWLRQERMELETGGIGPKSWHYEAFVVLEGKLKYEHPDMKSESDVEDYVAASVGFDWDKRTFDFPLLSDFTSTNWMRFLRDDTAVDSLTLAGSHCSSAVEDLLKVADLNMDPEPDTTKRSRLVEMNMCHYVNIPTQLTQGVRLLDLRVGPAFKINQGPFKLFKSLVTILDQVELFLKTHPSETVLVLVTWSSQSMQISEGESTVTATTGAPLPAYFVQELKKITQARVSTIYAKPQWPSLGSVRGKMVMLRGFDDVDESWGIKASSYSAGLDFSVKSNEKSLTPELVAQGKTMEALRKEKTAAALQTRWNIIKENIHTVLQMTTPVSLSVRMENDTIEDDENWVTPSNTAPWLQQQVLDRLPGFKTAAKYLWVFSDFVSPDLALSLAKLNLHGEDSGISIPK
ncbi:PLC-like phosphodiesterase [Xylariaceae sp. FL0594]|nr:PLC-like phosphodiesterase [Xylariaceae sp. FL0594]